MRLSIPVKLWCCHGNTQWGISLPGRPRLGTRGPRCRRLWAGCHLHQPRAPPPPTSSGLFMPVGVWALGHTFVLFCLQPSPSQHTKDTFLKKRKRKMYFFPPAFQLPELSGGMNGLGKISHRNKFTRDSWADKFSPQRRALRGLLAGDLPLVQSCLKRKTEQERGAFKSTPK